MRYGISLWTAVHVVTKHRMKSLKASRITIYSLNKKHLEIVFI